MTPTIEELEAKIRTAVEKAKQEGWEIRPKEWVLAPVKECCPLGALVIGRPLVQDDGHRRFEKVKAIAAQLGVSDLWADSFAAGFDESEIDYADLSAYTLGKKFRAELLGEKP